MDVYNRQGELFDNYSVCSTDFSRNDWVHQTLATLVDRLTTAELTKTDVIKWSCPVPAFGDLSNSEIATLGLNPSNKEFVDNSGNELDGSNRRFHTLKSLCIDNWSETEDKHLDLINYFCRNYFRRNPYDTWFKKLDYLISDTDASFYGHRKTACHLDLIPYATTCKWIDLNNSQRSVLLTTVADTLGLLLKNSPVRVLILNGKSVVNHFESISNSNLEQEIKSDWELPRKNGLGVKGISYKGVVSSISDIHLDREILVLGFNHNIQSSFGVTKQVTKAIRNWICGSINSESYAG